MPVITTEKVVHVAPKSEAAKAASISGFIDNLNAPFGTKAGENMGMPNNYRPATARVYVRNHSATHPWRRLLIAVSERRGAEDALIADKELAKIYNVDTLTKRVEQGKDMNRYKTGIFKVNYQIRVPGGPNGNGGSFMSRTLIVPPAEDGEEPKAVEVPEGTWDLYCGNYDRMLGYPNELRVDDAGNPIEPDPAIASDARVMLAKFWQERHNPVCLETVDGESTDRKNPFGFLEFVRVSQQMVQEPVNKELLTALDIIET